MKINSRWVSGLCVFAVTSVVVPAATLVPAAAADAAIRIQGTTSISGYMIEGVTFEVPGNAPDQILVRLFVMRGGEWNAQIDRMSFASGNRPHRGSFAAEDVVPPSQKPGNYSFAIGYCGTVEEGVLGGGCTGRMTVSSVGTVRVLPRKSSREVFDFTKAQPKGKRGKHVVQLRTRVPDVTIRLKQRRKTVSVHRWRPGVFKVRLPYATHRGQLLTVKAKLRGGTVTRHFYAAY